MDVIVGSLFGLGMGVIVIAGIYQLSKGKAPLATDATSIATTSLSSIFK
ncbi:MAG TPA: hypothetical protein VGF75_06285 [Candidatus Saccharimonadales bacterium]|jgi:hypothetical protein